MFGLYIEILSQIVTVYTEVFNWIHLIAQLKIMKVNIKPKSTFLHMHVIYLVMQCRFNLISGP